MNPFIVPRLIIESPSARILLEQSNEWSRIIHQLCCSGPLLHSRLLSPNPSLLSLEQPGTSDFRQQTDR
jgi:hypothetical protein